MERSGVGTPLETTVLLFKLLALLDQHLLFSFIYHASFETRYMIG
jgi:hypothetical protein